MTILLISILQTAGEYAANESISTDEIDKDDGCKSIEKYSSLESVTRFFIPRTKLVFAK